MNPLATASIVPEIDAIFSREAHVRRMLDFEAALARSEAAVGLIPAAAADSIAAACRVDRIDLLALDREAALAGTPVIPLVRMLVGLVDDPQARAFVHWGATSQDVIDSALALQMRAGLDLLVADLLRLCAACAALASQHRHTLMAGRTLLQQALPITFGLKAARWLGLVLRQAEELRERRERSLALQFGGAAGTLAALGGDGLRVAERLAAELDLALPELPWHAERDRIALIASALAVTAGSMSKIAGDLVLLAQTEVGEVAEAIAPGKGGSSAMPQKRNPVDAIGALASARLAVGLAPVVIAAMAHEHERAAGAWQAEWSALPDLFRHTAAAVAHTRRAVEGLVIDPVRMRANLDLGGGLLMAEALMVALAFHYGRQDAQQIVQAVCAEAVASGGTLRQAAHADRRITAALSPDALDRALDPAVYLGSTDALIDRALRTYQSRMTSFE